jgi:hypothetical protein
LGTAQRNRPAHHRPRTLPHPKKPQRLSPSRSGNATLTEPRRYPPEMATTFTRSTASELKIKLCQPLDVHGERSVARPRRLMSRGGGGEVCRGLARAGTPQDRRADACRPPGCVDPRRRSGRCAGAGLLLPRGYRTDRKSWAAKGSRPRTSIRSPRSMPACPIGHAVLTVGTPPGAA